jgi:hypothetical protein
VPATDKGLALTVEDQIDAEINVTATSCRRRAQRLQPSFTRTGSVTLRFERHCREDALPLRNSVSDTGIGVVEDKHR